MKTDYEKLFEYMEDLDLFENRRLVRRGGIELTHVELHAVVGNYLTNVKVDCGLEHDSGVRTVFVTLSAGPMQLAATWFDNVDDMPDVKSFKASILRSLLGYHQGLIVARKTLAEAIKTNADDIHRMQATVDEIKAAIEEMAKP
jgi:hypothetical protein